MIPCVFNKITNKLYDLDKLPLPLEVIDIIKSFAFHEVNTHPYYKIVIKNKVNISDKIERFVYIPGIYSGHWALAFVSSEYPPKYIQLQAVNCINCGEYNTFNSYARVGRLFHINACTCL